MKQSSTCITILMVDCVGVNGEGVLVTCFSISDHLTGNQLLLYIWPCTDLFVHAVCQVVHVYSDSK